MYEWVKALHAISIIAWMAGLLYLPRLYVYHTQVAVGSEQSELFKVMERRLLRAIMNPAMIASWIFGLWLTVLIEAWTQPWFHAKLLAVVVMTGAHMAMAKWRKDFEADRNARGHKFYRIANEVPTVLMVAVVILVIVKPF
ncbi:MAG: protoporphyrinogen oxidase HemJ [Marivibrio sp.]|uniref:protoporphyrinogen oxidase HemJ n=1 Tax=Marivibrio sp. TaxID=2039719 RepID=UPI0032ECBE7A